MAVSSLIDVVNDPYAAEFAARVSSIPHVKSCRWFPGLGHTPEQKQNIEEFGIVVFWIILETNPAVHAETLIPCFKQTLTRTIWANPDNYSDALAIIEEKVNKLYNEGVWPTNQADPFHVDAAIAARQAL